VKFTKYTLSVSKHLVQERRKGNVGVYLIQHPPYLIKGKL